MKNILLALAVATTFGAAFGAAAAPERGFMAQLHERYCDKLRESPQAYVLFVRRLAPIHGYTYADFAPVYPGDPVKADCRVNAERIAAVHRLLDAQAAGGSEPAR